MAISIDDDNSGKNDNLRYRKLYNWGRTLIISGILKKGDKFPSEHILARKFGYSRQTVRTAMNQLEEEGLISRVRGSGTYVEYKNEVSDAEKPHIGLIMSYYADYLFPQVYAGIASVLEEKGIKMVVNPFADKSVRKPNMIQNGIAEFFNDLNAVRDDIHKDIQRQSKKVEAISKMVQRKLNL